MSKNIIEAGFAFFLWAILVYLGIKLLLQVWWILALLLGVIMTLVIAYRIWRFKNRW